MSIKRIFGMSAHAILIVVLGLTVFVPARAHAAPPAQNGAITCGDSLYGGPINDGLYAEMWDIYLSANTTITVSMYHTSDDLDAYLLLHAPDGSLVGEDDDSGGNYDAWLSVTAPVDGTYTITATRAGFADGTTFGSYQLSVDCQQSGGSQSGSGQQGIGATVDSGPVYCNTPITNSADPNASFDVWSFTAQGGEALTITMSVLSGDLDPYLAVTDPNGQSFTDDDSGGGYDALVSIPSAVAGTYTIEANSISGQGEYLLQVTCAASSAPPALPAATIDSGNLACNTPLTNSIDDNATYDTWYFVAQGGEALTFTMRQQSGDLDPYLTVYAPDGTPYFDDDAAGGVDAQVNFAQASAGTYTVTATRSSGAGDYTLTVDCVAASAPPAQGGVGQQQSLLCGASVGSTINDATWYDEWYFSLQAGETLDVTMRATSGNLDPYIALYDGNGNSVAVDNNGGGGTTAHLVYTAPTDGWYTVTATRVGGPKGGTSGEYAMTSDCSAVGQPPAGPGGWQPGPITYPGPGFPNWVVAQGLIFCQETQLAGIGNDAWYLEWQFDGVATQQVSISMTATSGNLDPYLVLIYPDGTTWTDNDDFNSLDAQIDLTLPQSGTYTIQTSRSGAQFGTSEGSFRLDVACLSGGGQIPSGQGQQGQPGQQNQSGGQSAPAASATTSGWVLDRWNARIPLWTTYNLNVYTPSWGGADLLEAATDSAITFWSGSTAFIFTAVTDPAQADIVVNWAQGNATNELANAYVTYQPTRQLPQVYIDLYQPPTVNGAPDRDAAFYAMTHAFGHALGMEHSADPAALMYPHRHGQAPQLGTDDREQLLALYGAGVFPSGNVSMGARPFISRPFMLWAGQTLSFTLPYPAGVTTAGTVGLNPNLYALCPIDYYLPGAGSGLAWDCTWSWDDTAHQVRFTVTANTTAAAGSGIVAGRAIVLSNQAFELVDTIGLSVHPNQPATFPLNAPAGTVVVESVERFDPAGATDFGLSITPSSANTYIATASGGNANSVADVALYVIRPRTGSYSATLIQTSGGNVPAFDQATITANKRALAFMTLSAYQPNNATDFGVISTSQIAALSADPNAACSTANPMAVGALCVDAQAFGVQGTGQSQAQWGLYVLQEN